MQRSLIVRDPMLPQVGAGYELVPAHDPRSPNYKPPPTAPTTNGPSPRRQASMHYSSSTTKRSAQKLVEEIASAGSSSPKTVGGSMRRQPSSSSQQQQQHLLPSLTHVGSRDMKQHFQRKVYTPSDERQDPPMDPM